MKPFFYAVALLACAEVAAGNPAVAAPNASTPPHAAGAGFAAADAPGERSRCTHGGDDSGGGDGDAPPPPPPPERRRQLTEMTGLVHKIGTGDAAARAGGDARASA